MELITKKYQLTEQTELTDLLNQSAIFGNWPVRELYLNQLIERLIEVPQLLPVGYARSTRNRYDHVKNMIKILDVLSCTQQDVEIYHENFWKDLAMGILTHDIGHPPFGHAGERAISKYLNAGVQYSNSTQSERLLFHRYKELRNLNRSCIFDTLPVRPFIKFRNPGFDCHASVFLDFIDDLENVVGDFQDLWRAFKNKRIKYLFELYFPGNHIDDDIIQICSIYLRRKCPNFDMDSLYDSIVSDFNDIHTCLKMLKFEIRHISKEYDCILQHDELGEHSLAEILFRLENLLINSNLIEAEIVKPVTADIVSSMYLTNLDKNKWGIFSKMSFEN